MLAASAQGTTIYLGSNGADPNSQIQVLDGSGSQMGLFGAGASSAAALDGMGHVFTVTPGDSSSTVYEYDNTQTQLSSFVFDSGVDNGKGSPNYITDLAWAGSTLWASAYNGYVYQLTPTGTVLHFFDTGALFTGVTASPSHLYTSSGLGLDTPAPFIYEWDFTGALLATINTGLNDTLGLGFDQSSGNFLVGGVDVVSEVSAGGSIISTFDNAGVHTGLEVGDVGTAPTGVPEPATFLLLGGGLLAIGLLKFRRSRSVLMVIGGICALATSGRAAVSISSFTASVNPPQQVGTTVTFTTVASDTSAGNLRYRFRLRLNGGPYATIIDYGPSKTFAWTPAVTEGNFDVEVSVLNRATSSTATMAMPYAITPRAMGGTPVVTPTNHPMVALYSAPPCAAGQMRVRFKAASESYWHSTSNKPCNGNTSMNFYIGGMYASTMYTLRSDVINGVQIKTSADLTFTTRAASPSPGLPATSASIPLPAQTSLTEGITLLAPLSPNLTYAVDSTGKLVWYLPGDYFHLTRPAPGGTFLVVYEPTVDLANSGFREYDIAGNVLKQTNIEQINSQLAQMGVGYTINTVHHDVRRLENGNYLMLAMTELLSGAQPPATDILGDAILVMDRNFHILWIWRSFDHLDITRKAVLNETCVTGTAGCVILKAPVANDWTHGNSIAITPDNNILYSARSQDFVYKIAYQNGSGDGHVIWRLGKDGDFNWISTNPYPWQSHQHDAEYEAGNIISLFDNGNTRVGQFGGNSRGLVLQIDEASRTITPTLEADLGSYSLALGSAQKLSNGDHSFCSGFIPGLQSSEVTPSGNIVGRIVSNSNTYRTFRLRDLYSASF